MSIGNARDMNLAPTDREPLWAIGLAALLVATGFARRQRDGYSGESHSGRGDRT